MKEYCESTKAKMDWIKKTGWIDPYKWEKHELIEPDSCQCHPCDECDWYEKNPGKK